jgi:DNA polymerase-3 subunit alpha
MKLKNSKKGDRYATFVLEDKVGVVEVIAWPDTYRQFEAVLHGGEPVVVAGALEISEERCQVIADDVQSLVSARALAIKQVHVRVPLAGAGRDGLSLLKDVLAAHPGPCDAFLHLERDDATETVLALPANLRVAATEQIMNAVEGVLGAGTLYFR